MITPEYCQLMSSYNQWQNTSIYTAADQLTDEQRMLDRGGFFGSIEATLNHLLWGDKIWLSRFANTHGPTQQSIQHSVNECDSWDELKNQRQVVDKNIKGWVSNLAETELSGNLTWYSGAIDREVTKPKWILVMQMFNHQTHHRGQVHAMLTAAGVKPDDTDLPFMPDGYILRTVKY